MESTKDLGFDQELVAEEELEAEEQFEPEEHFEAENVLIAETLQENKRFARTICDGKIPRKLLQICETFARESRHVAFPSQSLRGIISSQYCVKFARNLRGRQNSSQSHCKLRGTCKYKYCSVRIFGTKHTKIVISLDG